MSILVDDVQVMPLVRDQQGASSGAIDTSAMSVIEIHGDCGFVVESDSNTLTVVGVAAYDVTGCDSITVDAAVTYTWV